MQTLVQKTVYVPYYVIDPEVTPDLYVPQTVQGNGGGRGGEGRVRDEAEARAWLERHRGELPQGGLAFRVVQRWAPQTRQVTFEEHVEEELCLIRRRYAVLAVRRTAAEVRVRAARPEDGQEVVWLLRPGRTFLIRPCRPAEGRPTPGAGEGAGPPPGERFGGALLIVRRMTAADALALLLDPPLRDGMSAPEWDAIRRRHGLLAFTAAEGDLLAGFALAKSHPALVHVIQLEGGTEACRLLLGRLAQAAGKRPLSVWCPVARTELRELLEGSGFVLREQGEGRGRRSDLFVRAPAGEEA